MAKIVIIWNVLTVIVWILSIIAAVLFAYEFAKILKNYKNGTLN